MREIKYRAWIKNADKMVDVIAIDLEKEDICWTFDDYVNWEQERVWIGFDDIALMQYTGLKDKNGKEIYEGDIVKSVALTNDHNQRGSNSYLPDRILEWKHLSVTNLCSYYPFCLSHDIEVIGNIYENPELMV